MSGPYYTKFSQHTPTRDVASPATVNPAAVTGPPEGVAPTAVMGSPSAKGSPTITVSPSTTTPNAAMTPLTSTFQIAYYTRAPPTAVPSGGTTHLPTLVFCIPPTAKTYKDFLRAMPRPILGDLGTHEKECHFCKKDFKCDSRVITTADKKSLEIPIRLPCEHVLGSICLGQWMRKTPADSCPLCRRQLFELRPSPEGQGYAGPGGPKTRILPLLFEYGRRSAEAGTIAGFEFNYTYTGASEIMMFTVKENPAYRGDGGLGTAC